MTCAFFDQLGGFSGPSDRHAECALRRTSGVPRAMWAHTAAARENAKSHHTEVTLHQRGRGLYPCSRPCELTTPTKLLGIEVPHPPQRQSASSEIIPNKQTHHYKKNTVRSEHHKTSLIVSVDKSPSLDLWKMISCAKLKALQVLLVDVVLK